MNEYFNNNILNPKYLFYGTSDYNNLIDGDMVMTSSFIAASAYAFRNKLKELSIGLDWYFEVEKDDDTQEVFVKMNNVKIDDELEAYIYVYNFDEMYDHVKGSIHYKSHSNVTPIDVIKIKFKDFKNYYIINN